ncbi:MAG: universal stress protein [Fidelibacterota bacterium]
MRFLLGIGGTEFSEPTLIVGSRIARSFDADLSVVYVGEKPKQLFEDRVHLARDALANWEIYHPGIEVLKWAYEHLKKSGFLAGEEGGNYFRPENMVEERGRFRMILPAVTGREVDLILREGKIVRELRRETAGGDYTLTIIGGSRGRRMAHDLLQYIPTSIFVVKNVDRKREYKILLCVDDSEATKRAVRFGATIAKNLDMFVNTLTVSKTTRFGPGYTRAANTAARYLKSQEIPFEQHFVTGDPVNTFVEYAGESHILVMGDSGTSPLKKFFVGSKPIRTLDRANCPILVVR